MTKVTFTPRIETIGLLDPVVPTDVISEEPLLFSASPEFARSYGGPLTRAALDRMERTLSIRPPDGWQWVIDTRSHMLMPGQFPAIGGWHCDAVPRATYDAQPDLSRMRNDILHVAVHVSTHVLGVSSTHFVGNEVTIDVDPEAVWPSVHRAVDNDHVVDAVQTPGDGRIVLFSMPTIHKAQATVRRGWRWWMRASMYYARPINKIRRQVQVYTSSEGAGW